MQKAIWIPGWYELDPLLEVGDTDEFIFWKNVPKHLDRYETLVFYNTFWKAKDALVAHGTIAKIHHETMGAVRKIDTKGLDYKITLESGKEYYVNAEEDPGKIYEKMGGDYQESSLAVNNWTFSIEFSSLSVPKTT